MNKKILILTLSLMLVASLSACGVDTQKENFKKATVEVSCEIIKPFVENLENQPSLDEVEQKSLEIIKKYGFESVEQYENLSEQYESDEKFKKEVETAIEDECGPIEDKRSNEEATTEVNTETNTEAAE